MGFDSYENEDGNVYSPAIPCGDGPSHGYGFNSLGTGFFIAPDLVLTCFHVVVLHDGPSFYLGVKTLNGERIRARVTQWSAARDPAPSTHDFAVLRLLDAPTSEFSVLRLAGPNHLPTIGEEVIYSGYPLETPGMFTSRGMLAGIDEEGSSFFIQGPVNKGNSGGALLDRSGKVIGIVTSREGGLSDDLEKLDSQIIEQNSNGIKIKLNDVDTVPGILHLVKSLDMHISTGIGYATDIKFAREYLKRHSAKNS